jgi:uncharacterized protein
MSIPDDDDLRALYASMRTIAVVGASTDESKPSNTIPTYMASQGYQVIGVSPKGGELFGQPVRASLSEVVPAPDVVDVFRPAAEGPQIVRDAAAAGATVIWFQPGTESDEAEELAAELGLTYVGGACIGTTHGRLGLGPGPFPE